MHSRNLPGEQVLDRFALELAHVQVIEESALVEQLLVGAHLDDLPIPDVSVDLSRASPEEFARFGHRADPPPASPAPAFHPPGAFCIAG